MKKITCMLFASLLSATIHTGCVFAPGPPDYGEEVAPPLPAVVELGDGPYYQYGGYHYRYQNERWHYSRERDGHWRELPRSHWPKEIRHRDRQEGGGESWHEHERRER